MIAAWREKAVGLVKVIKLNVPRTAPLPVIGAPDCRVDLGGEDAPGRVYPFLADQELPILEAPVL